jgi:hypothetical protein
MIINCQTFAVQWLHAPAVTVAQYRRFEAPPQACDEVQVWAPAATFQEMLFRLNLLPRPFWTAGRVCEQVCRSTDQLHKGLSAGEAHGHASGCTSTTLKHANEGDRKTITMSGTVWRI